VNDVIELRSFDESSIVFVGFSLQSFVASPRDDVRELIPVVVWVVTPVFCLFFSVVADGSIFFPACFVDVFLSCCSKFFEFSYSVLLLLICGDVSKLG
jgi:hypothetical protein